VIVVVTGSECTGKTTLAARLAGRYGVPHCREFAREYLDRKGSTLDATDVEPIARGQIALEDDAARCAQGLLIKDTDLLSTVVYARHYYGSCPRWVEEAARARLGTLYLLLEPDVPWVPDGVRDRPANRAEMHALFRGALDEMGACYTSVHGSWDGRVVSAVAAIDARIR
jgi:NadR type nicotinamide-nucleotide adenylyltransferase